MNDEQLAELEAQLIRQRDELVQEANRQIAFLNGKIEMIQSLRQSGRSMIDITEGVKELTTAE